MEHQVEWQYKVKIRKTPDIKSLLSQPGKVSRQRVPEWAAALISVPQVSSMFGLNRQVPALQSFVETVVKAMALMIPSPNFLFKMALYAYL